MYRVEDYYSNFDEKRHKEKEVGALLNVKRVMKLAPWFHELQMSSYLKSCDKILYSSERKYDFWAEKSLLEQQKAHEAMKSQLKDATSKFIGKNGPC